MPADLPTSAGHINFFQDLEHVPQLFSHSSDANCNFCLQNAIARMSKKAETNEAEKGFALAPSAKDLKPWYSERSIDRMAEVEDERRYL